VIPLSNFENVAKGSKLESILFLKVLLIIKSLSILRRFTLDLAKNQTLGNRIFIISYSVFNFSKFLSLQYKVLNFKFKLNDEDLINLYRSYLLFFVNEQATLSDNDCFIEVSGWSPENSLLLVQDSKVSKLKIERYSRNDLLVLNQGSKSLLWGFKTKISSSDLKEVNLIGKYEQGIFKKFIIVGQQSTQIAQILQINTLFNCPSGTSNFFGFIDDLQLGINFSAKSSRFINTYFSLRFLSQLAKIVNPRSQNLEIQNLSRLIIESCKNQPMIVKCFLGFDSNSKESLPIALISVDQVSSIYEENQVFYGVKVLGGKLILNSTLNKCLNYFDKLPLPDLVSGLTVKTLPNWDFYQEAIVTPYNELSEKELEKCIVLPTFPQDNWFHLVLESLVSLVARSNEIDSDSTILLNESVPDQFVEFLKLFGFHSFLRQKDYDVIRVKSCLLLQKSLLLHDSLHLDINDIQFSKNNFHVFKGKTRRIVDSLHPTLDGPSKPRKIAMISRRTNRGIINWKSVEEILTSEGYEVVDPGKLSIYEQIQYFSSATSIVQEGGASMANWIFCKPGTRVIFMNSTSTEFHKLPNNLAEVLDIDITRINCIIPFRIYRKFNDLYSVFHSSYKVNLKFLRSQLNINKTEKHICAG
jgi:hypothetical protein